MTPTSNSSSIFNIDEELLVGVTSYTNSWGLKNTPIYTLGGSGGGGGGGGGGSSDSKDHSPGCYI